MDATMAAKAALRSEIRAARAAMPAALREEASRLIQARVQALPIFQTAESVFAFVSYDTEVDTHPLIDMLLDTGRRLAVPRIVDKITMLSVRITAWDDLQPDRLGILAPVETTPDPGPFDIVITPGVAFTETGARLGYGRGYYDRWFQQHPGGCKIALAFESQIVPQVPVDEYDVPVDLIVTERRLIRPGGNLPRCKARAEH